MCATAIKNPANSPRPPQLPPRHCHSKPIPPLFSLPSPPPPATPSTLSRSLSCLASPIPHPFFFFEAVPSLQSSQFLNVFNANTRPRLQSFPPPPPPVRPPPPPLRHLFLSPHRFLVYRRPAAGGRRAWGVDQIDGGKNRIEGGWVMYGACSRTLTKKREKIEMTGSKRERRERELKKRDKKILEREKECVKERKPLEWMEGGRVNINRVEK